MTPQNHALSSERVHERCFWAQGIAQGLELYGKTVRDLPADLRACFVPVCLPVSSLN